MPTDSAVVRTANASRYLQQLCKHWSHRFETRFTPEHGQIALPLGQVSLSADADALRIDLAVAEDRDADQMRDVVQRHVERFAFRETLLFEWARTATDLPPQA